MSSGFPGIYIKKGFEPRPPEDKFAAGMAPLVSVLKKLEEDRSGGYSVSEDTTHENPSHEENVLDLEI